MLGMRKNRQNGVYVSSINEAGSTASAPSSEMTCPVFTTPAGFGRHQRSGFHLNSCSLNA